jgi:hypothetical protein
MKKYSLTEIDNIISNGFNFSLDQECIEKISSIALEVGSPSYVRTPVFKKKDTLPFKKKKKTIQEVLNDDDWETLRTFQPTKIEENKGIDGEIDIIRSNLNKLTDKNYDNILNTVVINLSKLIDFSPKEEVFKVSSIIFEIVSTNRFYSKIYANLFAELITKFDIMNEIFKSNFESFLTLFETIEYVDSNVNYDEFCKNNKNNEKRKALSMFFLNLYENDIIKKSQLVYIITTLITQIDTFISMENKKNEVDELMENVNILFGSYIDEEEHSHLIGIIEKIANSKVKDYLSLSNKTIFKCMDIIDKLDKLDKLE